jgi:aromatic-amino-acid transaminase
MFDRFPEPTGDALHAVMARFRADPRPDKRDLGVGVYRDAFGLSPIMHAVRAAERHLAETGDTKTYQALAGDHAFIAAMTDLVFGRDHPFDGRLAAIQGTGGTGSLRIAMEIARLANPAARLLLGTPSWPNHAGLAAAVGFEIVTHRHFDPESQRIDWPAIEQAAAGARPGDLFLLHGPCHNPTAADLDREQRDRILSLLAERGAIPLIDAAYYGLGDGLAPDLQTLRDDLRDQPRALLAVACSKSFGLYRERTGILFALCAEAGERTRVQGELERISRTLVSMPPAHGAAVVAHILTDPVLRTDWETELAGMRERMIALRAELEATGSLWLRGISGQRGIFRLLPFTPDQAERLGRDHAIHIAPSGRMNLAGLRPGDGPRLAAALDEVVRA